MKILFAFYLKNFNYLECFEMLNRFYISKTYTDAFQ